MNHLSIFVISLLLSLPSMAKVHMNFREDSPLPLEMQAFMQLEIEARCPDANQYQWTLVESHTSVLTLENGNEQTTLFSSNFVIISPAMDELEVKSEMKLQLDEDLWTKKVHSIKGRCQSL